MKPAQADFANSGVTPARLIACIGLIAAAFGAPAFGQTADDAMAMRWWNALDAEQMVALSPPTRLVPGR
jgi:hypothetical protein